MKVTSGDNAVGVIVVGGSAQHSGIFIAKDRERRARAVKAATVKIE